MRDERAAAADVAVEALLRICSGVGVRMLLEQRDGRHDEARRAEAAHQARRCRRTPAAPGAACRRWRGRRRCESACPALRSPASSRSRPCGRRRSSCRRRRRRDRRRACCRSGRRALRSASSSVTRGSILRSSRLPLTISVTGTSPGPTRRCRRQRSAPRASGVAAAVTALTTPADFRKSRRVTANPPGLSSLRAIDGPLDGTSRNHAATPGADWGSTLLSGDYARSRALPRPQR